MSSVDGEIVQVTRMDHYEMLPLHFL